MKRKNKPGLQLDLAHEDFKSYTISDEGAELKLRAFLFRDGTLYKDGAAVSSIRPDDIDYSTKQLVGQGASARVYYVLHKDTKEPLALKEIPITTKTHRDEVNAELAVLAAGIDNPHVIRHLGAFWNAETHCISLVMEWMAYSLADLTKLFSRLDAHQVQLIAAQLVAGCGFLHDEKRVIHRDIKPSNVLINSAGHLKLGDFGISKIVETMRINTSFVGTQLYMAPERLDVGEYTFVSDVWSLGLTLITCATGRQPWSDPDDEDDEGDEPTSQTSLFRMLQRMSTGRIPTFPEDFPPEAHDFISRCLERDPAKRASCAELAKHPFIANVAPAESHQELASLLAHVSQLTRRAAGGIGSAAGGGAAAPAA